MDLLTYMFDRNPQTLVNWKRVKWNDPTFDQVTVVIAKNPRSKKSICAAADIAELGRDIGRNNYLKSLLLDDLNCLDHNDVALARHIFGLLCNGVNSNESIEKLTISNFSHNNWQIGYDLGPFLARNPSLRSLCVMTGGGYTACAHNMRLLVEPLLERAGPLEELCFLEAGVDDNLVVALVDVFLQKPWLVPIKLQIAGCEIGVVGCKALGKLLKSQNCSMVELDIAEDQIDDDGAACLADALKRNGTLKELCLGGNDITSKGWKVFENAVSCIVNKHCS